MEIFLSPDFETRIHPYNPDVMAYAHTATIEQLQTLLTHPDYVDNPEWSTVLVNAVHTENLAMFHRIFLSQRLRQRELQLAADASLTIHDDNVRNAVMLMLFGNGEYRCEVPLLEHASFEAVLQLRRLHRVDTPAVLTKVHSVEEARKVLEIAYREESCNSVEDMICRDRMLLDAADAIFTFGN